MNEGAKQFEKDKEIGYDAINPEPLSKGNCCICNKPTEYYCKSCASDWDEFDPTYYCEEHYKTTVLTGNCCSGNEKIYNP